MLREGRIDYQQSLDQSQAAYFSNLDKNQNFDLDNDSYQANNLKLTNSIDTYISIEANTNPITNTNSKTNQKQPPANIPKVQNKGKRNKPQIHTKKG